MTQITARPLLPVPHAQDAELQKLRRRLERERSSRLEAEAIAERGLRDLYAKQQQIELLESVATIANQSSSINDALQFAVIRICQFTGWPVGHAYLSDGSQLSSSLWHTDTSERIAAFCRASDDICFTPGLGLPGVVMQSGEPLWMTDVTWNQNFPRMIAARTADLKAAFAFPVLVGREVAAVLEFFSHQEIEADAILLRLMSQIGTQLGRVVERKRNEDSLIHDASHDTLTGLPNRALFHDRLACALARHQRHAAYHFAVLFIDLDRFKIVNDSLGHNAGDLLIIEVGERLLAVLREEDLVARPSVLNGAHDNTLARLGGDEFTVLLEDISDATDAVRIADRIQEKLKAPFAIEGREIFVSASIGVASSVTGYKLADEVMRDADLAMYRAKNLGKARCELFDQTMHRNAMEHLQLETDLRNALQNEEFVVHYQPIISLDNDRLSGFEALVRWQRPGFGLTMPDKFIHVAEDMGLIIFIGMWVMREACKAVQHWQAEFDPTLTISVNVSPRQFVDPQLVPQVRQIIEETRIDPQTVRLEITESVTMLNIEQTIRTLGELRDIGLRLSIDDFGTGYSSLSYLHQLPLDVLKIDRSFIAAMEKDNCSRQIIQTIMNLAKNLGVDVVAEGLESTEQVECLKSMGCEFGQGYYYSRPVAPGMIQALLNQQMEKIQKQISADQTG